MQSLDKGRGVVETPRVCVLTSPISGDGLLIARLTRRPRGSRSIRCLHGSGPPPSASSAVGQSAPSPTTPPPRLELCSVGYGIGCTTSPTLTRPNICRPRPTRYGPEVGTVTALFGLSAPFFYPLGSPCAWWSPVTMGRGIVQNPPISGSRPTTDPRGLRWIPPGGSSSRETPHPGSPGDGQGERFSPAPGTRHPHPPGARNAE